ncbi:uncharacterized protein LOC125958327 [Anopheles darlingi]|uniref:uncharacterized protein LOC125958327 n=1 Tax=Anopheles darlingi TaxID=43151 RepID=UPI0021002BC5|nr:uncharacterized protein LOC125958327 [Anopheles darlingi]
MALGTAPAPARQLASQLASLQPGVVQEAALQRVFKLSSGRAEADLLGALARFTYFDRWSDEQRRDCCHRAHIRQYEPDQTVFVEGQAPVNYAHFVLSGECGLLQCLRLLRYHDPRTPGTARYRLTRALPIEDEITRFHRRRRRCLLAADWSAGDPETVPEQQPLPLTTPPPPPPPQEDDTEENTLLLSAPPRHPFFSRRFSHLETGTGQAGTEHHFFDLATYSRGSVFGIGEHMVDRVVFARSRVQCLLIPRYWLLEKQQNRGNVWHRIRIFLEQRQPSRDRLFRHFLFELRWHRYRRQLVDDHVTVHAPRHLPQLRDVPLVCRIEEYDVEPFQPA